MPRRSFRFVLLTIGMASIMLAAPVDARIKMVALP